MKTLALKGQHLEAGARFMQFADWEMPLLYTGIINEHMLVRQSCGLFDVSHMGKILVSGKDALDFLNNLSINLLSGAFGKAKYTHLIDLEGRIIDDIIITKVTDNEYLCVSNAVTDYRIEAWFKANTKKQKIENLTERYILLAIQGPESEKILQKVTNYNLRTLKRFRADFIQYRFGGASSEIPKAGEDRGRESPHETEGSGQENLADHLSYEYTLDNPIPTITSRTGYTGEDGFEILTPRSAGAHLWGSILKAGEGAIAPVGIGARDTLRLEKGYLLSGQDFDGSQTPLETGHERLIKWEHDFIGKDALSAKKERITKKLVGLLCSNERVIPRKGTAIYHGERKIGTVTSGTQSPCLRRGIGLGYVEIEYSDIGHVLELQIRGKREPVEVVKLPFV